MKNLVCLKKLSDMVKINLLFDYSGFHASFAEDELQLLYEFTCTDEWTGVKSPSDKNGVAK